MIPAFSISGALPPFDAARGPTVPAAMSPYPATMTDVVKRFGTTEARQAILLGLLQYRTALRNVGIVRGFQWLDGSFLEDVETLRGRAPGDMDLVTFAHRPEGLSHEEWARFVEGHPHLFDQGEAKLRYRCDAYFVDLGLRPEMLVSLTRYWFGLFSHQRATSLWKGMLQVSLDSDDGAALPMVAQEAP